MREELHEIRKKEVKNTNVLTRNIDEVDSDEDGGSKNDKEIMKYLVHDVLEQEAVDVFQ